METLNIKGMLKNNKLSPKISQKAWHMFTTILKQKTREHGRTLIQIDTWYPSSKICSNCQHKNQNLSLKQRTWTCPQCHTTHNRDVNAAKKIHNKGLEQYNDY